MADAAASARRSPSATSSGVWSSTGSRPRRRIAADLMLESHAPELDQEYAAALGRADDRCPSPSVRGFTPTLTPSAYADSAQSEKGPGGPPRVAVRSPHAPRSPRRRRPPRTFSGVPALAASRCTSTMSNALTPTATAPTSANPAAVHLGRYAPAPPCRDRRTAARVAARAGIDGSTHGLCHRHAHAGERDRRWRISPPRQLG